MLNAKILKLFVGDQEELKSGSKTKEIEMKKCRKVPSGCKYEKLSCEIFLVGRHRQAYLLLILENRELVC